MASVPTFDLPTTGSNPKIATEAGLEGGLNTIIAAIYGRVVRTLSGTFDGTTLTATADITLTSLNQDVLFRWTATADNVGPVVAIIDGLAVPMLDARRQEFRPGQIKSGTALFGGMFGASDARRLQWIIGATPTDFDGKARMSDVSIKADRDYAFHQTGAEYVWALTDQNSNVLAGVDPEGYFHANRPGEGWAFHDPDLEALQFAVCDEQGYILYGVRHDGSLYFPANGVLAGRAALLPYADGNDLRTVGAEDALAATPGPTWEVLATFPFDDRAARAIIDRPSIDATTAVGFGPGGDVLVPDNPTVLHIIPSSGQSLSVGAEAADSLVSTEALWPQDVLMFDSGADSDVRMSLDNTNTTELDPETLAGFIPLVAKVGQGSGSRGETIHEACGATIATKARSIGIQYRQLHFAAGFGGTPYDDLKQGTASHDNLLAAVTRAQQIAAADGHKVMVDGILIKHGEGNASDAGYYDDLIEWQDDLDTDIKLITGQAADVKLYMMQPSSSRAETDGVRAMVQAHIDSPNHVLVGADYPWAEFYAADFLHFEGEGYFLIGETAGLALIKDQWKSTGWAPLMMTAAARSGTTVTLTYHVPNPPLTLDTVLVSERDVKGFRYFDNAGEITVSSATVSDNGAGDNVGTITLALGATPSGTGEFVDYALNGHGPDREESTIPRGNVRDSRADLSRLDDRALYNWAVHQRHTVTVS